MIHVSKGVRPPEPSRRNTWPFSEMEVGDSFLVPDESSQSARSCAVQFSKRTGRKFSIRTIDGEIRCWRIK